MSGVPLLLLAFASAAGCSGGRHPAAPSPPVTSRPAPAAVTASHVVRVGPQTPVTRTVSGRCFTSSVSDPDRTDAYRCLGGNLLLDPCLPQVPPVATGAVLVCPQTPFGPSVRLRTTGPLPAGLPSPPAPMPWAVRTASGLVCQSVGGGTVTTVAGGSALYRCGPGGESGVLLDGVDSSAGATGRWTARYAPPGAMSPAGVRTVELVDRWS